MVCNYYLIYCGVSFTKTINLHAYFHKYHDNCLSSNYYYYANRNVIFT